MTLKATSKSTTNTKYQDSTAAVATLRWGGTLDREKAIAESGGNLPVATKEREDRKPQVKVQLNKGCQIISNSKKCTGLDMYCTVPSSFIRVYSPVLYSLEFEFNFQGVTEKKHFVL